jgi:hypothetical protein
MTTASSSARTAGSRRARSPTKSSGCAPTRRGEHHRPADTQVDDKGVIVGKRVLGRIDGEPETVDVEQVGYMDISPMQIVGISASADPLPRARRREPRADGLEHAAPGGAPAQGLPARSWRPAWRTSWPATAGWSSARAATARSRSPMRIASWSTTTSTNSASSWASTSGPASTRSRSSRRATRSRPARSSPTAPASQGELALGKNVLVAFMTWDGYNFEDAILLNGATRQGRRLHVDPHRRVRRRDPRDQAGSRGVHARHPERLGEGAPQPRRERHRPRRHAGPPGRHPGRQGRAQVQE